MKRSVALACVAFVLAISNANVASACLPWLDPLAWFGFYGCGYGYGCANYGCAPVVNPYPVYRPRVLPTYPLPAPAVQSDCNCHPSATAPAAHMTAVRVPVTTYRAVTQYVPQTTYRTQYQYAQQPAVAYHSGAYGQPVPSQVVHGYPSTSVAVAPSTSYSYSGPTMHPTETTQHGVHTAPVYSPPIIHGSPNVASPVPAGDIHGDHEYPTQSSRQLTVPTPPIRRVSYGVTPQKASRYRSSVR